MNVTFANNPTSSVVSAPPLWRTGLKAGALAAAATTGTAAVASALGVSFESAPGDAIPIAGFAQLTLFFTMVGVGIAAVIRRRSSQPRSTFTTTAVALTALSVVPDFVVPFDIPSKIALVLTHVVAAVIVISALRSQLPEYSVATTTA